MADLRERSDLEGELMNAQTDAMSPGELQARARVQELEQRLADAADDDGMIADKAREGSEEAPMSRAEIVELVKLGIMTTGEARERIGLNSTGAK